MESIIFEQHQAGSLHEAGHAVIASVLGRELVELSILEDEHGGGYVHRKMRESSPQDVMEEIVIAMAGEMTPLLWGNWPTDAQHDHDRIQRLMGRQMLPTTTNWVRIRDCLKSTLEQVRSVIGVLAQELSTRKVMPGKDAEAIITCHLPEDVRLLNCIELARLEEKAIDTITGTDSLTAVLVRFPHLRECWQSIGSPDLKERYIGTLLATLRDDLVDFDIEGVESSLGVLLSRFTPNQLSK